VLYHLYLITNSAIRPIICVSKVQTDVLVQFNMLVF